MFCVNCGAAFGESLAACASCGKTNTPALAGADMRRLVKEASSDALAATKKVVADPIAGLADAFAALGPVRARSAAIAFGIAFAVLTATAAWVSATKLGSEGTLKLTLGIFFLALVPFASIAMVSAGARKVLGGYGSIDADIFTTGVALLPVGGFFLLAAFLGIANFQAIALLSLFAWTYMLCILFTGCTKLVGIPERFAPPTISVMLLAAMWLTKVAATSLFGSDSSIGRLFN